MDPPITLELTVLWLGARAAHKGPRVRPAVDDLRQHEALFVHLTLANDHSAERLVEAAGRRVRGQAADPDRGHPMPRQMRGHCLDEAAAQAAPLMARQDVQGADPPGVSGRV